MHRYHRVDVSLNSGCGEKLLGSGIRGGTCMVSSWNGAFVSYDADGNLVSDRVHRYSRNARNQLAGIDSGGRAKKHRTTMRRGSRPPSSRSIRYRAGCNYVFHLEPDKPCGGVSTARKSNGDLFWFHAPPKKVVRAIRGLGVEQLS